MISDSTIEEIKASANTLEIISNFVILKKKGSDNVACCPFHDEKTPSFSVSKSKNMYKCFGCGKSGDGISFLMENQRMTYIEALRWIAEKNNITIDDGGKKKDFVKPVPRKQEPSENILDWFENDRKISKNTILEFSVTQSIEWMPQIQSEVPVICFNYYKGDTLVNIKFRGQKKAFKLAKDAELIFYNINSIKDTDTVYITEGEIDCMSLFEIGIKNVVSVPNGASVNGNVKLEYLDNCWEFFHNKKRFVLCVDNDAAGKRLQEELGRRLGYDKCFLVTYPADCKDANDVLIKHGKEELQKVIDNLYRYPLEGEVTMDDMFETVVEFYENGYPSGDKSNLSNAFDEHLTFYHSQLTIVSGAPGSGKSEVIDAIMCNLAKKHDYKFAVAGFECPPEFHVTKLAEKVTGKSFAFRKNPQHRMDKSEFDNAIGIIDNNFKFMNLNIIDVTMDGLLKKAEEFVLRYGINGLLIDPWNCIEAKGEGTDYILQCLNKLLNFLSKFKVHGFLIAHPTKLQKDKITGKYQVSSLYDISGSAHFFNRTHNGITVYRNFDSGIVDVYVQKVKQYWLGKIGYVSFQFNTETRQYIPINDTAQTEPNYSQSYLPIEGDSPF